VTLLAEPAGTLDGFELVPELEAHEPPEVRGAGRDDVRLLVSPGDDEPVAARFRDLPAFLRAGDVLVVNRSATVPAALDAWRSDGTAMTVHLATPLPDDRWLVEVRQPAPDGTSLPFDGDLSGEALLVAGGGRIDLERPFAESRRLTVAHLALEPDVLVYLYRHGHPIRYRHVPEPWPLAAYQTVFASEPGSAEMPSAARPFTAELVTRLVTGGIGIAPIVLHTGVSSLEGHEAPYPERYRVPATTAALVNAARAGRGRVIAVGTTAVRALETVADPGGTVRPGEGWTDLVLGPGRPARAVDGLLTGWHEPRSSHLRLLEAVAPVDVLARAYCAAVAGRFRWHEFGDVHLLIPAS
jgi:S-adenosylmethionine:tRNA ribosyltransferase-isomerase